MLEKPDLQEGRLVSCLRDNYALHVRQVAFLPLGADRDTAVYRAEGEDGTSHLIKVRRGVFDETSVILTKVLSDRGITQIIAPLATRAGELWVDLPPFALILYPFVEGRNGYETPLTDRHWIELGRALKRVHTTQLPHSLERRIRRENYTAAWREVARAFVSRKGHPLPVDPVAEELAAFLQAKRQEILDLVGRAGRLAPALQARSPAFVLCHTDVHAGNILIDTAGALYIVDWDESIFAPKERDLMYAGAGLGGSGHTPQEEKALFYQGYGRTEIDAEALAYYRYERIVQDIAVFCQRIFASDKGRQNRAQSLDYLRSNFEPNGTIDIAYQSDVTVGNGVTAG